MRLKSREAHQSPHLIKRNRPDINKGAKRKNNRLLFVGPIDLYLISRKCDPLLKVLIISNRCKLGLITPYLDYSKPLGTIAPRRGKAKYIGMTTDNQRPERADLAKMTLVQ